jgi:hypothetical protein
MNLYPVAILDSRLSSGSLTAHVRHVMGTVHPLCSRLSLWMDRALARGTVAGLGLFGPTVGQWCISRLTFRCARLVTDITHATVKDFGSRDSNQSTNFYIA